MAAFDWAVDLADELLTDFGETATIRRRVDGTPADADKPWEPGAPSYTEKPAAAVFLDHMMARSAGILLQEGQQAVFVPASDLGTFVPDPTVDALVRASGERWTIVKVETLNPNGQLIMHVLTVEK